MTIQRQRFIEVEIVGEHQRFAERIDIQPLIVRNGFFSPLHRIARIMAQPLIAMGKTGAEITQEGVHRDAVGQGNAELVIVLIQPRLQCRALAVGQYRANLLMRLEPFMCLGSDRVKLQPRARS